MKLTPSLAIGIEAYIKKQESMRLKKAFQHSMDEKQGLAAVGKIAKAE